MSSVPTDPSMLPEVRRFLDDRAKAEKRLQDSIDAVNVAIAALPAFASQAEAIAGTSATVTMSPLRTAQAIAALNPLSVGYIHFRDQKTTGTNGGTFSSGAWRTRDLNTTVTNDVSGASLSSNQITLPAGKYIADIRAPAYQVSLHQARLYNITDAALQLAGTSERAVADLTHCSTVRGRFTITASKTFEVQHQASGTGTNTGFGVLTNIGAYELYSEAIFIKVS